MIEDGSRLSFSISDSTFSITDNLTGKIVQYNGKAFIAFTMNKDVVLNHLKNLQEALMSCTKRTALFSKISTLSVNDTVVIREDDHFEWTLGYGSKGAHIENNVMMTNLGFEDNVVLSRINKTYAIIISADKILTPKVDIVRRVADAGLLVWVSSGHSIVCYESSVSGATMTDCLVDGKYYPLALVSVSDEDNTCTLFTADLTEIITYPLDDSIKFFYKSNEHVFDKH